MRRCLGGSALAYTSGVQCAAECCVALRDVVLAKPLLGPMHYPVLCAGAYAKPSLAEGVEPRSVVEYDPAHVYVPTPPPMFSIL